jgi:hypothetical protein
MRGFFVRLERQGAMLAEAGQPGGRWKEQHRDTPGMQEFSPSAARSGRLIHCDFSLFPPEIHV